MNKPELSPFTRWLGEALLNHDDPAMRLFLLGASEFFWKETGNPVHAWKAIQICTDSKPKLRLPSWANAYLRETAKRMCSPQAQESKDFRAVLPWILGFPKKKKGPGHLLRPFPDDSDKTMFAFAFGAQIGMGAKPNEALDNACSAFPAEMTDGVDTYTLWRWVKNTFEVTTMPRNNAEWRTAIISWHQRVWGPLEKFYHEQRRKK